MARPASAFFRFSGLGPKRDPGKRVFSLDTVNSVNTPPVAAALAAPLAGALAAIGLLLLPLPALARDSLGIFESWGAFRDPAVPRCYAIAMAQPSTLRRDYQPYATVGSWPRRALRNQVHFRLSRQLAPGSRITLTIGRDRFQLTGGGGDAWAADRRMDAAVVAAMRSAGSMTVSARDSDGNGFSNTWALAGAASAMDAATLGCARLR